MEDDDVDFTPSSPQNTSSNLASLFGFTKKPLQGNSSLTYTAPKAPRRESSPARKHGEKTKGKIIFSKAVQAYKLENMEYVSLGLIGIVISGCHNSHIYDIILYKKTKEHLSQIRISRNFVITLSPNKYVSFYDNNQQMWSLMFQWTEDVEQFSQKVAICKFYSQPDLPSEILNQDLTPPSEPKATLNDVVEVVYSTYLLLPVELSKLKTDIKENIKLFNYNFTPLSKGLIGCGEKCKRVIIIPHSLSSNWQNDLSSNKDLLVDVKLENILAVSENITEESKFQVDRPLESPVDSGAEDNTIKARGVSIKEALSSTKSQKANLISRMARMGQATLPVKQGLSAGPSDSDEETALTAHHKPRVPRSKMQTANPSTSSSISQTSQTHETPQQLSVIQNDLTWQQAHLGKLSIAYQQLVPVSGTPVCSPTTDPNLLVYISESRIQATELRMEISKISEKLDLVWNKIQNMRGAGGESNAQQQALMDSGGILASIQNMIAENEGLKKKIEEQKIKIEQQNDRIYNLLELSHKYLEQNATTHEKQSANETKLKTEMEALQKKELEMDATNKQASERIRNLESDFSKLEQTNKDLKIRIEELIKIEKIEKLKKHPENLELVEKTKEVEKLKEKLTKASETVMKLKERVREVITENESLKSVIKTQNENLEAGRVETKDSKTKSEASEKVVEGLKRQILEGELKTESKVESLSKIVTKLEEENKLLMEKIEKEKNSEEIKAVLTRIFSALKEEFTEPKEYTSENILITVEKNFNSMISESIKNDNQPKNSSIEAEVSVIAPPARESLQKMEFKEKELDESAKSQTKVKSSSTRHEVKSINEEESQVNNKKEKEEATNRYKSYDQGWRTAEPPSPFLLDDEDDEEFWLS